MPKRIPNKCYTPEFKKLVVESMQEAHLSYREAAELYNISCHKSVARWHRIYLEEGPEGLEVERRDVVRWSPPKAIGRGGGRPYC